MAEFRMPSLGADMEDGQLLEWEKHPGERVARGDIIAVVETQKGAIEIEAYEDGVLESVLVEPGTSVPVGTALAFIRTSSDGPLDDIDRGAVEADVVDTARALPPESEGAPAALVASDPGMAVRVRATPLARRRAVAAGLDITTLRGNGQQGAITLKDVERALGVMTSAAADSNTQAVPLPTPDTAQESRSASKADGGVLRAGMRDAIARAMTRAKREIPHYYLAHTVDLTATNAMLARVNADRGPNERVLLGALLIGAVAGAARQHPLFNGHYLDGAFQSSEAVHVGMAIRLRGGGLVAPAVHDADQLAADDLMARLRDLVERVREGRFRATELTDPTLTVSSVGERGVETLYGVIHPPQVCLVGFGAPHSAPYISDGSLVTAPRLNMTLAADHRVSDGHAGSRFLMTIARRLEAPDQWMDH